MNVLNKRVPQTVDRPTSYGDERFAIINAQACELRDLLQELREMTSQKFDELLGTTSVDPCDSTKAVQPESWVDRVISTQNAALDLAREIIKRVDLV